MRALYRWRVTSGREEVFIQAWIQATRTIRANVNGARGSMLLRSRRAPSEFIATARWNSFADWQAFMRGPPADPDAFRIMTDVSQMLSAEVFDEIEDLLDYDD